MYDIKPCMNLRAECYERGVCDYCHEACLCQEGQGDKTVDVVEGGGWVRLDCAECEIILVIPSYSLSRPNTVPFSCG